MSDNIDSKDESSGEKLSDSLERQYSQQDKWNPHARPHLKRVKRGVVTEGWQPGKTGIYCLTK